MIKALVLHQSPGKDEVAKWMVEPFGAYRFGLRSKLGLSVSIRCVQRLEEVLPTIQSKPCDVVFLSTSWKEDPQKTVGLFETIRQASLRSRLVYLDYFDQTSSPFFGILPFVDLYVKKQLLKDRSLYLKTLRGGYLFADFAVDQYRINLQDWHFGSQADESCLWKLFLGWNLATAKHLVKALYASRRKTFKSFENRNLDIHYRVSLERPENKGLFYNAHREAIAAALKPLSQRYRVVSKAGNKARIPLKQYRAELADAKLAVSPFGWGEVTDRDFEIARSHILLVKPDMSHLETEPDIYIPGKTYVPVAWDLGNLQEVCRYYLDHPQEAEAIAKRAKKEYLKWFEEKRFIVKIKQILDRIHA